MLQKYNIYQEFEQTEYQKLKYLPKISIVIPSYNQALFLERTILSVINQNYPALELILIDGASNDGSLEIIKKYEGYFKYWVSEKDKGQANAINKGFSRATGDLVGWLNSDDCYNYGAFYHLVKSFNANPTGQFFYGDGLEIDINDRIINYWKANLVLDRYLRFGGLIASHSAFWKREVHQPLSEELNCNVDGELWIRLVRNLKKQYVPFPLGSYRMQPLSKSSDEKWKAKWKEDDLYIEKKYGAPPRPGSYLSYEVHYVQRIVKFFRKNKLKNI